MLAVVLFFASTPTASVPESGLTAVLVSAGVLAVGGAARFLKNRKK